MLICFSHMRLFATPGTAACEAPLSRGFSWQNTSGLPCPPPGDLPFPGIEPMSPASTYVAESPACLHC